MSAEIDMSNGRANMAFRGDRKDIWHRLGDQMLPGESIDAWRRRAGLDWTAEVVPAAALVDGYWKQVENANFIVRSDTRAIISPSSLSDQYKPVQPATLLEWFGNYIGVDDRFELDVAGSLRGGSTIWATATWRDPLVVAGEAHNARVLMTTTFDGSGATKNLAVMERVVCANTLRGALGENGRAEITTRHNTSFDAKRVGAELATLAQSFARFKVIGDAMASVHMAQAETSAFFKQVLDIPADAKRDDISTRKMNQYSDIYRAHRQSVTEGAEPDSVWAALQAITRYVDHERSTRSDQVSVDEARFTSAQFGSGNALKGKAMAILMPRIRELVPVAA